MHYLHVYNRRHQKVATYHIQALDVQDAKLYAESRILPLYDKPYDPVELVTNGDSLYIAPKPC